ncbi:pesticidal protein Cry15Aa [Christiangramia fulva]|uniref:Pesticidal protein Cry15Aa n=1 Tax=Christiangramia fulva TaxID=2126553 RepID=A0A2R3Z2G5_9FLAO|nr:glycoside hydrolase family 130 protein [Christiangramia fulva]AVR44446.1 pesticidal protein Cry15Aa [Christiangramia fulva]
MKFFKYLLIPALLFTAVAFPQKEWMLGPFERFTGNKPILQKDTTSHFIDPITGKTAYWQSMATFNPAAIVRNDSIFVLFRAEEKLGEKEIGGHRSRIGMAYSTDGLHYKKLPDPVFYAEKDDQFENEWPGGVEDPRLVVTDDGKYILTYTQWNRKTPRLAVATSTDLQNWKKHGPVFKDFKNGKYLDMETKSGAIVTRLENGKPVAAKINGKYWMYFGVPHIYLATSEDLIHWEPLEDQDGKLVPVLNPRPGYFDSWLVEAGPPPLLTEEGIVVLYNAGNSEDLGIQELGNRVYTGGQALFDASEPWKMLDRSNHPFIKPELPFEKSGQYKDGTTFIEGLVRFHDRWFLYYGTADSMVGVVRTDKSND